MRKKILVAIILNIIIISVTLGTVSYLTVRSTIKRSLDDRLMLASAIAGYVDSCLQTNLSRLADISLSGVIDFKSGSFGPARKALETAYRYSLFTEGVFLLDRQGNPLLTYPARDLYAGTVSYNYVSRVLTEGRPVVSNVYTIGPAKRKVLVMMVPLRDRRDDVVGVAGGMLCPANTSINMLLQGMKADKGGFIDIIDSSETVLASDNPEHLLRRYDDGGIMTSMIASFRSGVMPGSSKNILAFVPLRTAPWGIIIGQEEKKIFGPAINQRRNFFLIVVAFVFTSLIFGVGASTSIVRPLKTLIAEANRIAAGDLSKPVGNLGSDEVLQLSRSFDIMREELAASLDRIHRQNLDLEQRVVKRTEQIRKSRQKVTSLLKKIFSSQEEERKRIARSIHDEALQDVLAILIRLDIYKARPENFGLQQCDELRAIALKTIDDMHSIIQNLRPTVLDDLGLEAAVTWLLERHLKDKGVSHCLRMNCPEGQRFLPEIERLLFLITQEAIINIARHAGASNVEVTMEADAAQVSVTIGDDGSGFDIEEVFRATPESMRGLGLLGMKERTELLDGRFEIYSCPGQGTRVSACVPLTAGKYNDNE